jgi:hypothetical protein
MANTISGLANLASTSRETMSVAFSAHYSGTTPGSSAWSIVARNIRISIALEEGRSHPPEWMLGQIFGRTEDSGEMTLVNQCVVLRNGGGQALSGVAPYAMPIRSGEQGMTTSYDQVLRFTFGLGSFNAVDIAALLDSPGASLTDPVNRTIRFQVNLFFATAYATTDQGNWDNIQP